MLHFIYIIKNIISINSTLGLINFALNKKLLLLLLLLLLLSLLIL